MPPDSRQLLGTYQSPRFRYRQRVQCKLRGEVQIVGLSNGRIPWPVTRLPNGRHVLILYRGLARAVNRETAEAIKHWWGASTHQVWKWRQALGTPQANEGTLRFIVAHGKSPAGKRALAAMVAAHSPERSAKIAAAMRGKPRPKSVIEGMRRRMKGHKQSDASRAKRAITHRALGTRPPWLNPGWTAAENDLLRTLPAAEVAHRTGRTLSAVYTQRARLGINDGRTVRFKRQS